MKVIQYNRGYTIHASEHEMAILRAMANHMTWSKDWDAFKDTLSVPQIRALRRQLNKGKLLRTNEDKRCGKFKGMIYDGPHNDQ